MTSFDSIVCLSQTAWHGDFQKAVVQLMVELSARHRVLFVDYQYTLKDWAMGLTGRADVPLRALNRQIDPLRTETVGHGRQVHVWTPPVMLPATWLPDALHDQLLGWNVRRLLTGLRSVMQRLDMQRPLVINGFNPVWGVPMLGQLNEAATIYYCFDEITTAGPWMSRHGARYEQEYLKRVDAVVTTSETLRAAKSVAQPRTYCVKNGANFSLFRLAHALAEAQPPTTPTVGYLGSADSRIDIDLVDYCVRTMPDVQFQFIGEIHEPAIRQRLAVYPNVTFIPPHQPADLPPLLARLSAAMIPFVCNRHTYTIYPLKINEYLAAGLPVVTTPFSPLDEFLDTIERADSPEQFAQALRRALADGSTVRKQIRMAMARRNSWEERAKEFEAVLAQLPVVAAAGPVPAERP